MGDKYEISYWDYKEGREESVAHVHWLLQALWIARKYYKVWPCVRISIRNPKL